MWKNLAPFFFTILAISVINNRCNDQPTAGKLAGDSIAIAKEPLPSWNDGDLKKAIIAYVKTVSDSTSPDFVPTAHRIATFDNDGTLWAERPYVQELFAYYQVKEIVKRDPSLAQTQPFKAVLESDKAFFAKGGEKALLQLVAVTHSGMTQDEFENSVKSFFETATYPGRNLPINKIIYQPQLELLKYLHDNGFKVFICTGGTVEFVRGISEQYYGISKERIIGTTFKYKFVDSNLSILREPALAHFNDKEGKPVSIQQHIGRRPVFACGNEGGEGDIAMLSYSQGNKYSSFQLIVNHDDSTREFYYQEKSNASLNAAAKNKWHVVSMKNDWKKIFPD